MKPKTVCTVASLAGLAFLLTWLVCCDSSGRHSPAPSAPAPERTAQAPETPPAPQDTGAPQPAPPRPPESADNTPPAEAEPELPDYVAVTERFHDDQRSRVDVQVEAPDHLTIETRNVRRLRIDRGRLPLRTNRSIILHLDGQGIEWTPGSTAFEFERSVNGIWAPVRPKGP